MNAFIFGMLIVLSGVVSANDKLNTIAREDNGKIVANLNITNYDPSSGDVSVRTKFSLPDNLTDKKNYTVSKNLGFVDQYTVNDSFFIINKEEPYKIFDAVRELKYEVTKPGNLFLYPLDTHGFTINSFVFDESNQKLPISYLCQNCVLEGYNISQSNISEKDDQIIINFFISRNISTVIFSLLLNFSFLILGLAIANIAIRVMKKTLKPDTGTIGFIGGLMFAIPVMRTIQPNVPNMGLLVDFLFFFPGELMIMFSLVIVLIYWLKDEEYKVEEDLENPSPLV